MKRILPLILLILIATLCFSMTSCKLLGLSDDNDVDNTDTTPGDDNGTGDENDDSIDLNGITLNDATFVYDGNVKVVEISGKLPEGVTVEYGDILNHAPTLAAVLGVELHDSVGTAVKEILK